MVERYVERVSAKMPALTAKRASPHSIRHYSEFRTMPTKTVFTRSHQRMA